MAVGKGDVGEKWRESRRLVGARSTGSSCLVPSEHFSRDIGARACAPRPNLSRRLVPEHKLRCPRQLAELVVPTAFPIVRFIDAGVIGTLIIVEQVARAR